MNKPKKNAVPLRGEINLVATMRPVTQQSQGSNQNAQILPQLGTMSALGMQRYNNEFSNRRNTENGLYVMPQTILQGPSHERQAYLDDQIMDLEGQGSQKFSVMGRLKKSTGKEEEEQIEVSRKASKDFRKTSSNKVNTCKYNSFKEKRNSNTPVSPNSRVATQMVSLANSRSATSQNLYQYNNIKGTVVQKNLALGSYEQANKYTSLKSSKSGKIQKPINKKLPEQQEYIDESSKNTFLNRAFQQDSSQTTKNQIYNLDGLGKITNITEGSMLNIVIPEKNDIIQQLIHKIPPEQCSMCQLQKGLQEMDFLLQQDIDYKKLIENPSRSSIENKYLDPQFLTSKQQKEILKTILSKQNLGEPSKNCLYERENLQQQLIKLNLNKQYMTSQDYYNSKITSDIMYNEPRHIVSIFKDYLIYDDFSEYLKRSYRLDEARERLPKIFNFYEKYSKLYPNYVAVPIESKYMFKNIERKQKIVDQKQRRIQEQEDKQNSEKQNKRYKKEKERTELSDIFTSGFVKELTKYNLAPQQPEPEEPQEPQFNFQHYTNSIQPSTKTEQHSQFSQLISNISKVDQSVRASLILPGDQTRCSFLQEPFILNRPSFNLSMVQSEEQKTFEPEEDQEILVAEQSELSVEEIPIETNELVNTNPSIVKAGTNLQSVVDDDGEPSKHFRNVNIADRFEQDIGQSEDFQKFLAKYKSQQNLSPPQQKTIIKLKQCPMGLSPQVSVLEIKHRKAKPSVKNSPRKIGVASQKKIRRNTSGQFMPNEKEVLPTQTLIKKLCVEQLPIQKIYGTIQNSPRTLKKNPPRSALQAYSSKERFQTEVAEFDDEADLPSIEDEYQNTIKASAQINKNSSHKLIGPSNIQKLQSKYQIQQKEIYLMMKETEQQQQPPPQTQINLYGDGTKSSKQIQKTRNLGKYADLYNLQGAQSRFIKTSIQSAPMTPQDRDAIQVFGVDGPVTVSRKPSAPKYSSLKTTSVQSQKRVGSLKSIKNGSARSNSGMKSKSRGISPMSGGSAYGPTYVRSNNNIPKIKKTIPAQRGRGVNTAMLTSKISTRSGAVSQNSQKSISSAGSRARVMGQFNPTQPPNLNPMSILQSTKKPSNQKYTTLSANEKLGGLMGSIRTKKPASKKNTIFSVNN